MNELPTDLDADELLSVVQRSWDSSVEGLDYLAVGFGAHHLRARVGGESRYFVTAPVETFVVPFADRAVSVTPWLSGPPVAAMDEDLTAAKLQRLHAVDPATLGADSR